ncbi:MAG TPA: serine/threonine protein kinase [Gammaproteobacteria bacterium]|jgi:hypothetical protein
MDARKLVALSTVVLLLAGCDSGDINLQPTNIDNSTNTGGGGGGGGGGEGPCASYTTPGGTLREGVSDGEDCIYPSTFSSATNPVRVDLDIPLLDNGGVHIFQDVLAIGANVSSGTAPAGGTGPVLTIAPGSTLAFNDESDYLVINRGSRIVADGTPSTPITFTSVTDAVLGTVGPEDVQQWGGVVINGNGITNNCTDAQRAADDCHVVSEGQPVHYGGDDNDDNSGILRYVVVKHTGSEVAPDDELNGITFNAVGSGTVVSHIETYSTYDDGIEFFGGAVDVDHFVAVYVRDDSIDYSDGYIGTIDTALVVQAQMDGNRCIEADNIGETRAADGVPLDTAPLTNPTITNLTCVLSVQDIGTHSDTSEGPTLRRGPQIQLVDSIVFGAYADDVDENSECFELAEDNVTNNWAQTGESTVTNSLFACELAIQGNALPNGDTQTEWILGANPSTNGADYSFNAGNVVVQEADLFANGNIVILDSFYTATALVDNNGDPIVMTPASGQLGAVTRDDDWTADWTYGLHPTNQGQALWFGNP